MPTYSDPTSPSASAITQHNGKAQPAAILCLVGGILALVVAGGIFYETYSLNSQIAQEQTVVTAHQKELDALKPVAGEVSSYSTIATTLHTLFDSQILWEQVLGRIEARLYKHIAITTIQASDTAGITLSGYTPTYDDYAKLYASLTDSSAQKYFTSVRPVSVAKVLGDGNNASKVTFTFILIPAPTILHPTPSPAS